MSERNVLLMSFLIGLGIDLQVYLFGCIGISEIVIMIVTPALLLKDLPLLKRHGFGTILVLLALSAMGAIVSSVWNDAPSARPTIKFLASMYVMFCGIVVFHRFIQVTPYSVGMFTFGLAVSCIASIWFLHPQESLAVGGHMYADISLEEQTAGAMFWASKLRWWLVVPLSLCYYKTPLAYSILIPLAYVGLILSISVSGRSSALAVFLIPVVVIVARKKRRTMRLISRHFVAACLVAMIALVVFKQGYAHAATAGYLGEEAYKKYVHQTSGKSGVLGLLMGGRAEFFVALNACLDKPIIGWGGVNDDEKGYWYDFLSKYATPEDFQYFINVVSNERDVSIPSHSHLTIYWMACGIIGLVYWLYILYLIFQYFRRYIAAIPQLFGFFVSFLPLFVWDIFFTPMTKRFTEGVVIAALLAAKAVSDHKMQLPYKFEEEAQKYDVL